MRARGTQTSSSPRMARKKQRKHFQNQTHHTLAAIVLGSMELQVHLHHTNLSTPRGACPFPLSTWEVYMGLFLSTHQSAGLTGGAANRKVPAGAENSSNSLSACVATKSGRWSGGGTWRAGQGTQGPPGSSPPHLQINTHPLTPPIPAEIVAADCHMRGCVTDGSRGNLLGFLNIVETAPWAIAQEPKSVPSLCPRLCRACAPPATLSWVMWCSVPLMLYSAWTSIHPIPHNYTGVCLCGPWSLP